MTNPLRKSLALATILAPFVIASGPSVAQYSYDPSAADELGKPGNLYFGAARDEGGGYVPAVTITLETNQTSFILVTDEKGRFRARLPLETQPANVKPTCSKPGYLVLRVTKRPGPKGGPTPVQVDCLLRRQVGIAAVVAASTLAVADIGDTRATLETARRRGDIETQRRHAWSLFLRLTQGGDAAPDFAGWYAEDEAFAPGDMPRAPGTQPFFRRSEPSGGLQSHGASGGARTDSAEAPVLAYSLYNAAAYAHLRRERLHDRAQLERLRRSGGADATIPRNRSVADFPADTIVLKTAWWPVARDRITPLPVWDPGTNAARRGGNDYTRWTRVVGIDSGAQHGATPSVAGRPGVPPGSRVDVDFAGRRFAAARRVPIAALPHVVIDAATAARLGRDPGARKLAALVLGRPLRAGDALALVGAHVATKEIRDWVWGTFWWHDEPDLGPYAAGRPDAVQGAWRQYLLDVTFDDTEPRSADGNARIAFNPWLEARFPDAGEGGGIASNCLACHRRASYPAEPFLPVTRGVPDLAKDPAYAPGKLRTNFLWSVAIRGTPPRPASATAP